MLSVLSCGIYLITNGAQGIYLNVLNLTGERKTASLLSILDSILKFFLIYFSLSLFINNTSVVLAATAVGGLISFAVIKFGLFREKDRPTTLKVSDGLLAKQNLLQSFPLMLPTALTALKTVSDRWILTVFVGVNDLSIYSVLLQIGFSPMILILGIAQTFYGARIYEVSSGNLEQNFFKVRKFVFSICLKIMLISCFCILISFIFSDSLFRLFISPKYLAAATYLPLFVLCGAVAAINGIIYVALVSMYNTSIIGKFMLYSTIAGALGSGVLVLVYDFTGAIIGLVFINLLTLVVYTLALIRGPTLIYKKV